MNTFSGNTFIDNGERFCGRRILDVDLSPFADADWEEWEQHTLVVPRVPAVWPGLDIAVRSTSPRVEYSVGKIEAVTDDTMTVWVDIAAIMSHELAVGLGVLRSAGVVFLADGAA